MIVPARSRQPRTVNYRRNGVWPGLGAFDAPARPNFIDPGYPPDPGIVAQNTAANNAYQRAVQVAEASNNYDQCEANAQNANSQAQYDQVIAACRGQAAIQTAPMAGDLPVTYYTPGQPLSYTPGGAAIPTPTYSVPTFAQNAPVYNPPVPVSTTVPVQAQLPPPGGLPPSGSAQPLTPAGKVIVTSSGAPTDTTVTPAASGFSFSSIPAWGWGVAAVVGFLALKGGK